MLVDNHEVEANQSAGDSNSRNESLGMKIKAGSEPGHCENHVVGANPVGVSSVAQRSRANLTKLSEQRSERALLGEQCKRASLTESNEAVQTSEPE